MWLSTTSQEFESPHSHLKGKYMKKMLIFIAAMFGVIGILLITVSSALAWDGRVYWDGQGYTEPCQYGTHWVLSGNSLNITGASLTVGSWNGAMHQSGGGSWSADSEGYVNNNTSVYADYIGDLGEGFLKLSHCIDGTPTDTPFPTSTSTDVYTETPTNTPTKTPTVITPTITLTNTPMNTPTRTATYVTNTPTITSTGTQSTSTATATRTQTPTQTSTPVTTETSTPTNTVDPTETSTVVPTVTPINTLTATPKPPSPAYVIDEVDFTGDYLGTAVIDGVHFILYSGMSDANGTLLLPSTTYGASVYQNTMWVHRLWKTGWLHIEVGDTVIINNYTFVVVRRVFLPYGVYPDGNEYKIATCYSDANGWAGVEVYYLK